ncbi:11526_t:CDS:10 [Entrophospora sp. SA101]|nr:11526_t:CDS:10 [Entrophospora sp. SA101]
MENILKNNDNGYDINAKETKDIILQNYFYQEEPPSSLIISYHNAITDIYHLKKLNSNLSVSLFEESSSSLPLPPLLLSSLQISAQRNNSLCLSSQSNLPFNNNNINDHQRSFFYNAILHTGFDNSIHLPQNTTNGFSNENRKIDELENDALEMLIRLKCNEGKMDIGNENREDYNMEIDSNNEKESNVGIANYLGINKHDILESNRVLLETNRKLINNREKPPYSYSSLIGQAILQSPEKKLIVNDIFKWISSTYPYYSTNQGSWKNSIRHNLSKSKMFIRVENGNSPRTCWSVDPDLEHCFVDGVFSTLLSVALMFDSFLNYQKDPKGCNLSYMHPYYIKQNGFDSEQTRFAGKYSLYLYRDQPYDTSNQPLGIPALFIPGNAGSYKQVRSIAAETSKLYYEVISKQSRSFVDFNEEYSALHGHSLCEQAEYLNDAIRYILSLYPSIRKSQQTSSSSQPYPDPTAVILIGHSMGGVVARTLFQTPNFQPGSINTILTMSTPHTLPPASFDWKINTESSSNSLMDVTLISIAGGNLDTIVCSDSTNINSLVPDSNGFTVFTTSIPKVWTSMDHQCILWCEQLVKVVANTLLNIVDIRRSTQTIPTSQRMKVFRKNLLTGLEDSIDIDKSPREFFDILDLGKGSYQFLDMGQRLVLNNTSSKSQIYLMPIPPSAPHSTLNTFTFLTDQSLSKYSGIKLLLCDVMPTEVPERVTDTDFYSNDLLLPIAPKLSCFYISSDDIVLLPESTFESKNTFSDKTFNFVKLKVKELGDYQYIVVMFDELNLMNKGFFIGEFYDESTTIMEINKVLMDGIHIDAFPEHNALVSNLKIPVIDSSLLTYKISIQRSGCDGQQHFAPFLRQSISSMYESKFFVNVNNIELNIHGRSPFGAGFNNNNNGSNSNNSFIMNQKGLELQFWIDPTCPSPLSIDIEFDFYGSLGKIVMRFQTVLAAFPFIIVIITFYHQLKEYNHSDLLPIDSYINERLLSSSLFEIDDILLGNQNLCFWFLPALFLILSTGITTLCWILLSLFIKYVAGIIIFINNLGLLNLDRQLFSRPTESNTSQLRRRVITATILFILVATFVPYQFAFLVAFFVHLMSCIRSLVMAHLQIYNYYHYLHSILMILFMLLPFNIPILMVWIRNISVSWFEPFSWDNNVLAIAPIVFYVEIITNVNNMLPRIVER